MSKVIILSYILYFTIKLRVMCLYHVISDIIWPMEIHMFIFMNSGHKFLGFASMNYFSYSSVVFKKISTQNIGTIIIDKIKDTIISITAI